MIGKLEVERLFAEYAREKGDAFSLYDFMDEFNKAGMIPVSLMNWEMNNIDSDMQQIMGQ